MNNNQQFMNTKFVGHHVSAGGYIFYKDKDGSEIFVALIRNKKGEWWIPKGHVEAWEDEKAACYREIEEEVGITKENLLFVDYLETYSFSFLDENKLENTKDIHTFVFEATHKFVMDVGNGGDDVKKAEWFTLESALEHIMPYSKAQLEKAIEVFKRHIN